MLFRIVLVVCMLGLFPSALVASTDSLLYVSFKNHFKTLKDSISSSIFSNDDKGVSLGDGELVFKSKFKNLLPYYNVGADASQTHWFPGKKIELGCYDILHLLLFHHPTMLYGPIWVDEVVATFSKNGIPLDACVVARNIDYQNAIITGEISPYTLRVFYERETKQGDKLKEYLSYRVNSQGKILKTKTPLKPSEFTEELKHFRLIKQPIVNWYSFSASLGDKESSPRLADGVMSPLFSERYMPIIDQTHSWQWYWGGRYPQKKYSILLTHSVGQPVYWEDSALLAWVLSTVSSEGILIDQVILGVDTSTTGVHTSGTLSDALILDLYRLPSDRLNLTEQQTTFTRNKYSIDEEGKIHEYRIVTDSVVHRDSLLLNRYM